MAALQNIMQLADTYTSVTGIARSTLSWRIFNDGKKLDAIFGGADLQVTRYERAIEWFLRHWPTTEEWPIDTPRPDAIPDDGAASRVFELREEGSSFTDVHKPRSWQTSTRPLIFPALARSERERQAARHALLSTRLYSSEGLSISRDDMHDRELDREGL